jgi:hypothetical protein
MSGEAVQIKLPTGEVIWARVAVDGPRNVASSGLKHLNVDDLCQTVHGVSETLKKAVGSLAPDEIEIEFGLELALKSGMIVSMLAEAGATASIKVTLNWKPEPSTPAPSEVKPSHKAATGS